MISYHMNIKIPKFTENTNIWVIFHIAQRFWYSAMYFTLQKPLNYVPYVRNAEKGGEGGEGGKN